MVETVRGYKPKAFSDFRRLLDDREIDAVVVVTPDHWHAIPTVRALRGGQGRLRREAAELQRGRGTRDGRRVDEAQARQPDGQSHPQRHAELPAGRRARAVGHGSDASRACTVWKTSPTEPEAVTAEPPTVPAELDYDFWLGPAPKRPYHPLRAHFTYRHFWDYSGGTFIDFWCHIVDVAVWALDLKAPRSVDRRRAAGSSSTTRPRRRTRSRRCSSTRTSS